MHAQLYVGLVSSTIGTFEAVCPPFCAHARRHRHRKQNKYACRLAEHICKEGRDKGGRRGSQEGKKGGRKENRKEESDTDFQICTLDLGVHLSLPGAAVPARIYVCVCVRARVFVCVCDIRGCLCYTPVCTVMLIGTWPPTRAHLAGPARNEHHNRWHLYSTQKCT